MAHFNKEDWEKDLSKALESFTDDWLEKVKESNPRRYHQLKSMSKHAGKLGANALHSKYSKEQIEEWAKMGGTYGKIQGKKNVESGHWQQVLVMGGKVQGKILGKKNVESGHLDRIRELQKKVVLQFDKDGNFIKEYECQGDAARETNTPQGKISQVCNGKRKTAGGFIWKFKE